jgi:hypothetical protein
MINEDIKNIVPFSMCLESEITAPGQMLNADEGS